MFFKDKKFQNSGFFLLCHLNFKSLPGNMDIPFFYIVREKESNSKVSKVLISYCE